VSEFAVDLSFQVTASSLVTSSSGVVSETLAAVAPADRSSWVGPAWAADTTAAANNKKGPQLIRSVRARLSIRSREADRTGQVSTFGDGGTDPVMGGLYRFNVGTTAGPNYARVRTMQADIAIRNQKGATWL
jgi:hypothetical protein